MECPQRPIFKWQSHLLKLLGNGRNFKKVVLMEVSTAFQTMPSNGILGSYPLPLFHSPAIIGEVLLRHDFHP
jgi:hypothetical protein